MNETELGEIRERSDDATDGPWTATHDEEGSICHEFDDDEHGPGYGPLAYADHPADADFIAHARTDIPLLLAEVDRLSGIIERAITSLPETLESEADHKTLRVLAEGKTE